MVNYREILRLRSLGYSRRQISASAHCSTHTASFVVDKASELGIKWPLDASVSNAVLDEMFHPERRTASNPRKEPDYAYVHRELAKPGVNLSLLWTEYCNECRRNEQAPYMYTQFCDLYRKWARLTKATMRIQHKPGDVMQVDWAGNTLTLYDPGTGEVGNVYLFVAVLPCSCKAYVEPCLDMKQDTWLSCHAHAFTYYGGVTRLLIPDNLKTGVTANTKFNTVINRSYQELAEYYGTAIVPARVRHPQDKSAAEGTVKYASTWIIAALRNRRFLSMSELSEAVSEKLEELNAFPFKKREGNRNSAYDNEEKAFMKPLPLTPYEPAVWSTAKVHNDYLISDGKNKYSVPFDLIGETVDIRTTKATIEVFFHGSRVASHPRKPYVQRDPIIQPEHMPEEHRMYLSYNQDSFLDWAKSVGTYTTQVVEYFLSCGSEPEQGYKSCASLAKLADRYGCDRLERACNRLWSFSAAPTVRNLSTILKNNQDKLDEDGMPSEDIYKGHGITRGAAYFSRKEAKIDD